MANVPVLHVSGQKLRAIRERELLLTRRAMGDTLGRSAESVKRYEREGLNAVPGEYVIALAKHLEIPLSQLRFRLHAEVGDVANDDLPAEPTLDMNDLSDELKIDSRECLSEVPLFDLPLAAGGWREVPEAMSIGSPTVLQQGRFRVRISGDSMMPLYADGQIVEFQCNPEREVGRDYYVQLDDNTAT